MMIDFSTKNSRETHTRSHPVFMARQETFPILGSGFSDVLEIRNNYDDYLKILPVDDLYGIGQCFSE